VSDELDNQGLDSPACGGAAGGGADAPSGYGLAGTADGAVSDGTESPGLDNPGLESQAPIRLQKLLAQAGVGSRRHCEGLIRDGRVSVDGARVDSMGFKAGPGASVEVDGAPVKLRHYPDGGNQKYTYILLNKPLGVISGAKDQFGRKTVVDIVKDDIPCRVFPVGRLDYNTSGLILLTDDGGFAHRATHPKFGVEKKYAVVCDRPPGDVEIGRLRCGVTLDDGAVTSPAWVFPDAADGRRLTIVLREGRNRQIRRMLEAVGLAARSLERVAVGALTTDGLMAGEWRVIGANEAELIFDVKWNDYFY